MDTSRARWRLKAVRDSSLREDRVGSSGVLQRQGAPVPRPASGRGWRLFGEGDAGQEEPRPGALSRSAFAGALVVVAACCASRGADEGLDGARASGVAPESERAADWRELYDGSDLSSWELGVYGESDEYEVREDGVVIPQTAALAGLTFRGDLPRVPYRLSVEATRLYGADFFLGVTFPVADDHLTLVLGGWGGMVSGFSSIDGLDASRNATRTLRHFPDGDRHEVEIEVTGTDVRVLVDGEALLATSLVDREVGLRVDVEPSHPLGIATYATSTLLHRVRVLELSTGED